MGYLEMAGIRTEQNHFLCHMSSVIFWLSSSSPFWTGLCSSTCLLTKFHLRQLNTCIFSLLQAFQTYVASFSWSPLFQSNYSHPTLPAKFTANCASTKTMLMCSSNMQADCASTTVCSASHAWMSLHYIGETHLVAGKSGLGFSVTIT